MEMTKNIPSVDSLLEAVGLQKAQSTSVDVVGAVAIFATGLLVGAGLGLLFAPESGQKLRSEIRDRLVDLRASKPGSRDDAGERSSARAS